MKRIKNAGFFLVLLLLAITMIMCDDDDAGIKVTYKIDSQIDMITSVAYKNEQGTMTVLNPKKTNYATTIQAYAVFDTTLMATFSNTTNKAGNYVLSIFIDGKLAERHQGIIPSGSGNFLTSITYHLK